MIELKDRILLENGDSIVDDIYASDILLSKGEIPNHIKVIPSDESNYFGRVYSTSITADIDFDNELLIQPDNSFDKIEFDDYISNEIIPNIRGGDEYDIHIQRLQQEIDYVVKHNHQSFIMKMKKLLNKFKEDDIVYGVGRGSACSSYLLYVMGVHDINPIKYEINPKEFFKEIDNET